MNEALAQLHLARSPRIILGLRKGEEVPVWVTHILDVRDGTASTRHLFNSSSLSQSTMNVPMEAKLPTTPDIPPKCKVGSVVVDMKDVDVTYGSRKVKPNSYGSFKFLLTVPYDFIRFSRTSPGKSNKARGGISKALMV